MKITGIKRASRFSPNSENRDAAIFDCVTSRLTNMGHCVSVVSEDCFEMSDIDSAGLVFSMARSQRALTLLAEVSSKKSTPVINHPSGLLQLSRKKWKECCKDMDICASGDMDIELKFPCWVKRDDGCAQGADDVCFAASHEELRCILSTFKQKGIRKFLMEEHIDGDLIKFYGVAGTGFFSYCYPGSGEGAFSKFGLEVHNGTDCGYAFNAAALAKNAERLAESLDIPVFGGDAVVTPTGEPYIIDFNDWPSFAPCRDEASEAIARLITKLLHK